MGEFCKAKPGDVVYSIPRNGDSPVKWFLKEGEKKVIKAVSATGEEVDYNPEEFTGCLSASCARAIDRAWENALQSLKISFENILAYRRIANEDGR